MSAVIFAGDLHGSVEGAKMLLAAVSRHKADRVVLTGDLLSGRSICRGTDYTQTLTLLGQIPDLISARGNCDSRGDELALGLTLPPYCRLEVDGHSVFVTHGHRYGNLSYPPEVNDPALVITGHTHVYRLSRLHQTVFCNVGSLSFPRGGNPPTYALYSDGSVSVRGADGTVFDELKL